MSDKKNFLDRPSGGSPITVVSWAGCPIRPYFTANSDAVPVQLKTEFGSALAREIYSHGRRNIDELCLAMAGPAFTLDEERALARRTCVFVLRYVDTLITERGPKGSASRRDTMALASALESGGELPEETFDRALTHDEHISRTFYSQMARSVRDFERGEMMVFRTAAAITNALIWTADSLQMSAGTVLDPVYRFLKRNV